MFLKVNFYTVFKYSKEFSKIQLGTYFLGYYFYACIYTQAKIHP